MRTPPGRSCCSCAPPLASTPAPSAASRPPHHAQAARARAQPAAAAARLGGRRSRARRKSCARLAGEARRGCAPRCDHSQRLRQGRADARDRSPASARLRGAVPLVVDPKHRDFARYRGATTVTPNLHELEVAAGRTLDVDDTAGDRCRGARAARKRGPASRWSSRSATAACWSCPPRAPRSRCRQSAARCTTSPAPAIPRSRCSRSRSPRGAARRRPRSSPTRRPASRCARWARLPCSAASIRDALAAHPDGKLLSRHDLAARAATWRTAGKRIVFTNGCFDLLHAGHLALLGQAAQARRCAGAGDQQRCVGAAAQGAASGRSSRRPSARRCSPPSPSSMR